MLLAVVVLALSTASATNLQNIEDITALNSVIDVNNTLDLQGNQLQDLGNPDSGDDALPRSYADSRYLERSGDYMQGDLGLNGNQLKDNTGPVWLQGDTNISGQLTVGSTECGPSEYIAGDGTCNADNYQDGDTSTGNENDQQVTNPSADTIGITDGNGNRIDTASITDDTILDDQQLSTTGDDISIDNGNTITFDDDDASTRCSGGEYLAGDGTCNTDTDSDTDNQNLNEVLTQGNSASGQSITDPARIGETRRYASMGSVWHDSFEDNSLNNWAITTQNNGAATGIGTGGQAGTTPIGDYLINMEGRDVLTYQSNIDLSNLDAPVISFYWACRSCDNEGGIFYISNDGGSSWTQVRRLRPQANSGRGDGRMQYEEISLSGYGTNGSVRIRFEGSPGGGDDFAVDNINIGGRDGLEVSSSKTQVNSVGTLLAGNDLNMNNNAIKDIDWANSDNPDTDTQDEDENVEDQVLSTSDGAGDGNDDQVNITDGSGSNLDTITIDDDTSTTTLGEDEVEKGVFDTGDNNQGNLGMNGYQIRNTGDIYGTNPTLHATDRVVRVGLDSDNSRTREEFLIFKDATHSGGTTLWHVGDTGTVTQYGTLDMNGNSITNIADGSILENDIDQNTLDDSEVADNSLTEASIAGNSVGASELIDNSVEDSELQDNVVDNSEVQNGDSFTFSGITNNGNLDMQSNALNDVGSISDGDEVNVKEDIQTSGISTDRVIMKETWPGGRDNLNGDLGTWDDTGNDLRDEVSAPPYGNRIDWDNGNNLVSPGLDLKDYSLYNEGDGASDTQTFTSSRVFMVAYINSDSLDENSNELFKIQVNGTGSWETAYVDNSNEDSGSNAGWKKAVVDITPYINQNGKTYVRFDATGGGGGDKYGVGRVYFVEAQHPSRIGGVKFAKDGADTPLNFWDQDSNAQRSLKWDNSANEFQIEDGGGTMRDITTENQDTDTQDEDENNEDQSLSISGDTLSINDGSGNNLNSVSINDNVNDADADSTNERQGLSVSDDTITIYQTTSESTSVDSVTINDNTGTDSQTLGENNGTTPSGASSVSQKIDISGTSNDAAIKDYYVPDTDTTDEDENNEDQQLSYSSDGTSSAGAVTDTVSITDGSSSTVNSISFDDDYEADTDTNTQLDDEAATSAINANGNRIDNVGSPNSGDDAINRNYADSRYENEAETYWGAISLADGTFKFYNGTNTYSGSFTIPSVGSTICSGNAGACVRRFASNKWRIAFEMPDLPQTDQGQPNLACQGFAAGDNEVDDGNWGHGIRTVNTDQNGHCTGNITGDCAAADIYSEADSHDTFGVVCDRLDS
ncbi:MAG: beta strand repeat-containing protein [Candidatus Nanohaloarchaea archaeon]